jgi:hypothetical protein
MALFFMEVFCGVFAFTASEILFQEVKISGIKQIVTEIIYAR